MTFGQKIWKPFRDKWRSVPAHIRKGLLRLYIVVSTLWVIWFVSQILIVVNSHPYSPVWARYVSSLFWTMLFVPIGSPIVFFAVIWIADGFRKPQIKIDNLRDRITTDILSRPDIAAYEFLATGSLFGKKCPRVRLDARKLSFEAKAVLPNDFYGDGPDSADPNELAKIFGIPTGKLLIEELERLFVEYGYDRNQMLNKIVDEEIDRLKRKLSGDARH